MKKIICLIISVMLVFCLVSCDSGSETNNPDPTNKPTGTVTAAELVALVNAREQAGYGDNTVKVTMDMIADTTVSGVTSQIKQSTEMYMKESAANPVASVKMTVALPGEADMVTEQYFANGYLYSSDNGTTYKKATIFEAVTGENSMTSGDMNDLIDGALESKVDAQADGSYKLTIKIDPKSNNPLIDAWLEGLGAQGITINSVDAEITVDKDYFLSSMVINIDLGTEIEGVGTVTMDFKVEATAQLLENYEIQVPAGIDIENATEIQ